MAVAGLLKLFLVRQVLFSCYRIICNFTSNEVRIIWIFNHSNQLQKLLVFSRTGDGSVIVTNV